MPGNCEIFWANLVSAEILHPRQGEGFRGKGERQDRRVSGVYLAVHRWRRQIRRKEIVGPVDRRLDLLLCHIEAENPS